MARLLIVRSVLVLGMVAAVGCRGDSDSRRPVPSAPGSLTPPSTRGADPPPGDDNVVDAPPEVANKVALREIVHGLARPVLLTFAPGDARHRLFVVEQRGAIRILEGATLLPKPFFTIK